MIHVDSGKYFITYTIKIYKKSNYKKTQKNTLISKTTGRTNTGICELISF